MSLLTSVKPNINLLIKIPDNQVQLLSKSEKPLHEVPKFSKRVEKIINDRLSKPRSRSVLTNVLISRIIDTTIVPLSMYVKLIKELNFILYNAANNYSIDRAQQILPKLRHIINSYKYVPSRYRKQLVFNLTGFQRELSIFPNIKIAARKANTIVKFRPYLRPENIGECTVLSDHVAKLMYFACDIWLGAEALKGRAGSISVDDERKLWQTALSRIRQSCPDMYKKHSSIAQRQLRYTYSRARLNCHQS